MITMIDVLLRGLSGKKKRALRPANSLLHWGISKQERVRVATLPKLRYDSSGNATGGVLLSRHELGISLETAFTEVDAFVLLFLRDTNADDFLYHEPDNEARYKDPREDGYETH